MAGKSHDLQKCNSKIEFLSFFTLIGKLQSLVVIVMFDMFMLSIFADISAVFAHHKTSQIAMQKW